MESQTGVGGDGGRGFDADWMGEADVGEDGGWGEWCGSGWWGGGAFSFWGGGGWWGGGGGDGDAFAVGAPFVGPEMVWHVEAGEGACGAKVWVEREQVLTEVGGGFEIGEEMEEEVVWVGVTGVARVRGAVVVVAVVV